MAYPKPSKIASFENIKKAWQNSRDAIGRGGAPGIDGIRPIHFKENLETNILKLRESLLDGGYKFNSLKPSFIEKTDESFRVICVPTVKDRLVQRLILQYLCLGGDKLNALTPEISYGVIKGRDQGVHAAIKASLKKRKNKPWILKTDVSKFFDQIPREYLISKVSARLEKSSVVPLIHNAIQCEIKAENNRDYTRIENSGIKKGRGLRQGMPLSPLLSNLVLSSFDRKVKRKKIDMLRYADDIIIFCNNELECKEALSFVEKEMKNLELSIPSLGDVKNDKTQILSPDKSVIFLGVEIYPSKNNDYLIRIPKNTIERAIDKVREHKNLDWNIAKGYNHSRVMQRLNDIPDGYIAAFSECTNLESFIKSLNAEGQKVKQHLLEEIFGEDVFASLTQEQKIFMGFL